MTKAVLEQAVGLLPNLSPAELEQLGTKVAALRAFSGPVSSSPPQVRGAGPAAAFTDLLFKAVADRLSETTGAAPPPVYAIFVRSKAGSFFVKGAEAACAAHGRWFSKATRVETAALVRIYTHCLFKQLDASGKPMTWVVIGAMLRDLPSIMDAAFPGYYRNGMMSIVLDRAMKPGPKDG